jgi:hypothetical protein
MYRMRKISVILLFFLLVAIVLQAEYNDFYSNFIFDRLRDPNTGLTIFPTLLIPMGGRYEGMGTAYTAVSDDSGFIESNPAGSSVLENTELSFLHHAWIADANIEGLIYTMRFNNLGIGFGFKFLYVPFTEYNEWGQRDSKGLFSETIATINLSYNLFSGYKFHGLAIGTNFKFAYRHVPKSIYPGQCAATGMFDFGILTRFNLLKFYSSRKKNFSIGLVLKNLGFRAKGEPLPTMISFGIAYAPVNPLLLSIDFNLPISFNRDSQPAEKWYFATGFNLNITDFLSFQGGLQIKENPRISFGGTINFKKISFIVNYNIDLSGGFNPLDKFSIEAKINLGDRGRFEMQRKVEKLYADGLEAYSKGNYEEAISFWEEALKLDPDFAPAKENLEALQKRLELQKELEDRQKFTE